MSKIPFTLEAWLKDKNQKVETRSGKNVRIICWDKIGVPIVALVGDADDIVTYNRDGTTYNRDGTTGQQMQLPSDLFIVTPEPTDMSKFRMKVSEFAEAYYLASTDCESEEYKTCDGNLQLIIDKYTAELLALAKKGLLSEKMLIEQTYNPDISKAHELGKEEGIMFGKAEALKNLPRWKTIKKDDNAIARIPHVGTNILGEKMLYIGENAISISCLMRLPGFNED